MAGFVMMGLIAVLIVYISVAKKKKRAVVISAMLIGVFYLYVSYSCGPNRADVRVMKPMAEKISEYIVKHGIPESLKDIPDLPYRLEGCERKVEYNRFDEKLFKYVKINIKEHATSKIIEERCYFFEQNRKYYLYARLLFELNKNIGGISIDIGNNKSKTWDTISFHTDKNGNTFSDSEINFGSSRTSGICNPMRQ